MTASLRGVFAMAWGSVFASLCAAFFFQAFSLEPAVSPIAATFLRIAMNFVLIGALWGRLRRLSWRTPNVRIYWIWGGFGALCVVTYFSSVKLVGAGLASVLFSSFGLLAMILSFLFLGVRTKASIGIIAVSTVGFCLMVQPHLSAGSVEGVLLGLASGLFGALAFLTVGRLGTALAPEKAMVYWTAVCLPVTGLMVLAPSTQWPQAPATWIWFGFGGLFAGLSQYFMAQAYGLGPMDRVSAVSYLAPALSIAIDRLVFGRQFELQEAFGIFLILLAGVFGRGNAARP